MACELGKFPHEVAELDMEDLLEFAGYLSLQLPERAAEDDVENKIVKSLGKPT